MALSFVQDADDILTLRRILEKRGERPFVVAKIERAQALTNLRDILEGGERADGSSLFRGLGLHGASDILLRPRLETAFLDPFSPARGRSM